MFTTMLKIVDTYIGKITDGTLRTTQDLYAADHDRLRPLCSETRTGYLQINNTDLLSHTLDDYRRIVSDDALWDQFVATKLDCYFSERVDLSPLGDMLAPKPDPDADPTMPPEKDPRPMSPESLIRLSLGRIESQFPGGLGQDYGDEDLRDLISAKGMVMYHNYRHLHAARRQHITKLYRYGVVVAGLALAWLALATMLPYNPLHLPRLHLDNWRQTLASPVVVGLPVAVIAFHLMSILTRRRHRALGDQFNAATRLSSATVGKCAIVRQDAMIFAAHAMFEMANSGKEDYWAQGRLKRWTEVNAKWCELIFWLNGRVAGNANYVFIRSKLIGMSLQGLHAQARFDSLKTTTAYLGLLALILVAALPLAVHNPVEFAITAVFSAYMAWQILRLHGLIDARDVPDAVAEVLHSDSLQTMKSPREARLHEEVARFMKREKLKQLYAERTRLNSGVINDVVGSDLVGVT